MSPYLSRTELRDLSGRHHRATIIAWLKVSKLAFVPDADGWPKVARALCDRRLGLAEGPPPAHHAEPDFSALKVA